MMVSKTLCLLGFVILTAAQLPPMVHSDIKANCPEEPGHGGCPLTFDPVCGSDGRTYPNNCVFCQVTHDKEEVTVSHQGQCESSTGSKLPLVPIMYPKCDANSAVGKCTKIYKPVCGTDGKTYPNECLLCYHHQNDQKDLYIIYRGKCNFGKTSFVDVKCTPRSASGACTREYMPVCGTDGVTYPNECVFCYHKQTDKTDIEVAHRGECQVAKTNLIDVKCPPRSASGACTREYMPVCGTDGVTYPNQCVFCYHKQTDKGDIEVAHRGECKTSLIQVQCTPRSATGMCTREYNPVCGTDGITYPNECVFCYHKQTDKADIEVAHRGECQVSKTTLVDIKCSPHSASGVCTLEYMPLCGSDGVTYPNECVFCYHKQTDKPDIDVAHRGECQVSKASLTQVQCSHRSATGMCTREYNPVCGTDGVTYPNECVFCYHKQTDKADIEVAHRGQCKTSLIEVHCSPRSASGICTREYMPVCGTDGVTYPNQCVFCYHKQTDKADIEVAHRGECKVAKTSLIEVKCSPRSASGICTREYMPVCGTDGVTYPNECEFCYHKQTDKADIEVAHRGECQNFAKFPLVPIIYPKCDENSAKGKCTKIYKPVCGTDGKTYPNECILCYHHQNDNKDLYIIYHGECKFGGQ